MLNDPTLNVNGLARPVLGIYVTSHCGVALHLAISQVSRRAVVVTGNHTPGSSAQVTLMPGHADNASRHCVLRYFERTGQDRRGSSHRAPKAHMSESDKTSEGIESRDSSSRLMDLGG